MEMRRLMLLGLALVWAPPEAGLAQLPTAAAVFGRVLAADDGQPIRFSLLYLVPSDTASARARVTLTDSAGAFLFRDLAPGEYRIRLERIGYEPEPGPPIHLAAGEQRLTELSSVPRPVRIAPIVVGSACYGAGELEDAPQLAALWRQAARAAEARRLFDRSYRYTVTVHEKFLDNSRRATAWRDSTWTHVNDPVTAAALEEHGADLGYGRSLPGGRLRVAAPELPELFGPSFLRTHCLTAERSGRREARIGFRPVAAEPGRIELRGTVVLDRAFAVRRLEFVYLLAGSSFATGVLRYDNVGVPGGQIRFAQELELQGSNASGFAWRATTRLDRYRAFTRDTGQARPHR